MSLEDQKFYYVGAGKNHTVFSNGNGIVIRVFQHKRDPEMRRYEEAFYFTVLSNSDFKSFIPKYFGMMDLSERFVNSLPVTERKLYP
jgi:hypothetical protein